MDLDRQTNHQADAKSERSAHAGTGVNDGVDLKRFGGCRSQSNCGRGAYFRTISTYICITFRSNVMPINATKDALHLRRDSRTGESYR
jgi:hypothetical protein